MENNTHKSLDAAFVSGNTAAAASSSLSDVPSAIQPASPRSSDFAPSPTAGDDANTDGMHEEGIDQRDNPPSHARAIGAADGSEESEDDVTYPCHYCDKSYSTETGLKRHLTDMRTKCARDRSHAADDAPRWRCPRCKAHFGKKYSAERHILSSCWKICDECCQAGAAQCDAAQKDGDCTHCGIAGIVCTKLLEALPECTPELHTGPSAQGSDTGPTPTTTAAIERSLRHDKRKAIDSPEVTSEGKPATKRLASASEGREGHRDRGRFQPAPSARSVGRPPASSRVSALPMPPELGTSIRTWIEAMPELTNKADEVDYTLGRQRAPYDQFPLSGAAPLPSPNRGPFLQNRTYQLRAEHALPVRAGFPFARGLYQGYNNMAQASGPSGLSQRHPASVAGVPDMAYGQIETPPGYCMTSIARDAHQHGTTGSQALELAFHREQHRQLHDMIVRLGADLNATEYTGPPTQASAPWGDSISLPAANIMVDIRMKMAELTSTIAQQEKMISDKDAYIHQLKATQSLLLHQNQRLQRPPCVPLNRQAVPSFGHVTHQHHQRVPAQGPQAPSFMSLLEAVREPMDPMPRQQYAPLVFPTATQPSRAINERERVTYPSHFPFNGYQAAQFPSHASAQGVRPQVVRPQGLLPQGMAPQVPVDDAASRIATEHGSDDGE